MALLNAKEEMEKLTSGPAASSRAHGVGTRRAQRSAAERARRAGGGAQSAGHEARRRGHGGEGGRGEDGDKLKVVDGERLALSQCQHPIANRVGRACSPCLA